MTHFACSAFASAAEFFAYDCSCALDQNNATDVTTVTALIDMASDMVCILSGYNMRGRCTVTVAPFGTGACYATGHHQQYATDGYYYAAPDPLAGAITLRGPSPTVTSITIAGVALAPTAYTLVGEALVRIDGENWPMSNSWGADGWRIVYSFGPTPDQITKDAVCELVCELAKPYAERRSNIKSGITSLNVQGANAQLIDDTQALIDGEANLEAVARFLGIYNPQNVRAQIGIWTPDDPWQLVAIP